MSPGQMVPRTRGTLCRAHELCQGGVPSHISPTPTSTAFLHSVSSAHSVSSWGPRNDVSWLLSPQYGAAQLLEDTQSKSRFACHRPCRQNQEHCRQKSACKALTYPSAFRNSIIFHVLPSLFPCQLLGAPKRS